MINDIRQNYLNLIDFDQNSINNHQIFLGFFDFNLKIFYYFLVKDDLQIKFILLINEFMIDSIQPIVEFEFTINYIMF